MRRRLLLLAPLLGILLAPCTAPAAEPIRAVPASSVLAARAPAPARTDGGELIAWIGPPGVVHVAGWRGGARRTTDVSAACLEPPRSVTAVGGQQVLFDCLAPHDPYPRIEPRLLDVKTGEVRVPAGASALLDAFHVVSGGLEAGAGAFWDVGRYGIRFRGSYYKESTYVAVLDLRTGASALDFDDETSVVDLDSPKLRTRLCRPIRQVPYDLDPGPFGSARAFDPLVRDGDFALQWGPRTSLSVQRCASHRKLVLQVRRIGAPRFEDAGLGGEGIATWTIPSAGGEDRTLRAYLSDCDARVEWRIPLGALAQPLSESIVVSEPLGEDGPWRIRHVSLRGLCPRINGAWVITPPNGIAARARSGTLTLPERATTAVEVAPEPSRLGVWHTVVRPGADLPLGLGAPARAVRWRLGDGSWERAVLPARAGGRLAVLPHLSLPGPRRLTLDVRFRQGGAARFAVRLVPGR